MHCRLFVFVVFYFFVKKKKKKKKEMTRVSGSSLWERLDDGCARHIVSDYVKAVDWSALVATCFSLHRRYRGIPPSLHFPQLCVWQKFVQWSQTITTTTSSSFLQVRHLEIRGDWDRKETFTPLPLPLLHSLYVTGPLSFDALSRTVVRPDRLQRLTLPHTLFHSQDTRVSIMGWIKELPCLETLGVYVKYATWTPTPLSYVTDFPSTLRHLDMILTGDSPPGQVALSAMTRLESVYFQWDPKTYPTIVHFLRHAPLSLTTLGLWRKEESPRARIAEFTPTPILLPSTVTHVISENVSTHYWTIPPDSSLSDVFIPESDLSILCPFLLTPSPLRRLVCRSLPSGESSHPTTSLLLRHIPTLYHLSLYCKDANYSLDKLLGTASCLSTLEIGVKGTVAALSLSPILSTYPRSLHHLSLYRFIMTRRDCETIRRECPLLDTLRLFRCQLQSDLSTLDPFFTSLTLSSLRYTPHTRSPVRDWDSTPDPPYVREFFDTLLISPLGQCLRFLHLPQWHYSSTVAPLLYKKGCRLFLYPGPI